MIASQIVFAGWIGVLVVVLLIVAIVYFIRRL